jgi:hypothetical protein
LSTSEAARARTSTGAKTSTRVHRCRESSIM